MDEFAACSDLQFTEIYATVTIGSGPVESVFTIDDWCLPKSTCFTHGCSPSHTRGGEQPDVVN